MKVFRGYNARVDPADLSEEYSPDCSNVQPKDDALGTLGERKGVTAVNPTAFPSRITGLIPLTLPSEGFVAGSTTWLIPTADGEIWAVNSAANTFPSAPSSNYVGGTETYAFGTDDVDLTYPATSIEVARNSISVDLSATRYAKIGCGLEAYTSTSAVQDYELYVGALIDGTVVYMAKFSGTIGGAGNFIPLNAGAGTGGLGVAHPGKGTATAVAVKLVLPNGWAAGATGGDFIRAKIN